MVSVDVNRPRDEAFAYVIDPSRFAEWQGGVVSGSIEGDTHVGAICTTTRRIAGSERTSRSRVTKHDPPTAWGVHGIDGLIRATVDVDVAPLQETNRSARTALTARCADAPGAR